MDKILFKHELFDAWRRSLTRIKILDSDTDNVIINKDKYTISVDHIEKIKKLLSNPELYQKHEILFPPVLDGTSHKILFSSDKDKKINCSNLWYWDEEDAFDSVREDDKKEDIEYTKLVIDTINKIQEIIYENNIDFYILDDEEDEE